MSAELKQAEAALDAFEAKLLADIGLDPNDGPIDAYLTGADFEIAAKLDRLRDHVSLLLSQAA
ncbi:hypothetical protein [Shinella oryzae]|uniref:Uncharacterized protein n=1 Tax=Shinella oryzae TaxID=2871820 RepID=A0ABY9K3K1_9HYPH|nr:hypothetical protein [Shinella oryzae]WLS03101.1 hypothetical protein Q9315_00190 [Shinella oryzae]